MSSDETERAIKALIDADPMLLAEALLHTDAVRRVIDGSGLPLASQLELRENLDRRAVAWG